MSPLIEAIGHTDCNFTHSKDFPSECPAYDTKQSDGEAPVMLELWRMPSTPLLPLLPSLFWPRVEAPDRVLFMGQTELFHLLAECKQITFTKLLEIELFLYLTVCK